VSDITLWAIKHFDGVTQFSLKVGPREAHGQLVQDDLMRIIPQLAQGLTDAQRKALAPHFTGGLILPDKPFEIGPQG
jgi:hypothetical protein